MFIAILVLLGIAGAIWYFARKQTQTVNLSHGDVTASNPSFEETEAKLKEAQLAALKIDKKLDKMVEKIDEVLATTPVSEVKTDVVETPSKKVKAEIAKEEPVVAPTVINEAAPAPQITASPLVETPKPAKKKRRYYPKKK
jgi:peptidoglycan hydrolase CwlO-like protein